MKKMTRFYDVRIGVKHIPTMITAKYSHGESPEEMEQKHLPLITCAYLQMTQRLTSQEGREWLLRSSQYARENEIEPVLFYDVEHEESKSYREILFEVHSFMMKHGIDTNKLLIISSDECERACEWVMNLPEDKTFADIESKATPTPKKNVDSESILENVNLKSYRADYKILETIGSIYGTKAVHHLLKLPFLYMSDSQIDSLLQSAYEMQVDSEDESTEFNENFRFQRMSEWAKATDPYKEKDWFSLPMSEKEELLKTLNEQYEKDAPIDNNRIPKARRECVEILEHIDLYLPWDEFVIFGGDARWAHVKMLENGKLGVHLYIPLFDFKEFTNIEKELPTVLFPATFEKGKNGINRTDLIEMLDPIFTPKGFTELKFKHLLLNNQLKIKSNPKSDRPTFSVTEPAEDLIYALASAILLDYYPVEVKPKSQSFSDPSVLQKPWKTRGLPYIVFMNALPRVQTEDQGGTHASPHLHQRRGHWRRLLNERFKNHPMYKGRIRVRRAWIGTRVVEKLGNVYRVLTEVMTRYDLPEEDESDFIVDVPLKKEKPKVENKVLSLPVKEREDIKTKTSVDKSVTLTSVRTDLVSETKKPSTDLWIQHDAGTQVIENVSHIPYLHTRIETEFGVCNVIDLRYDYHSTNGNLRVYVYVKS